MSFTPGVDGRPTLVDGLTALAFGAAMTMLSVIVLAGRRPRAALTAAALLSAGTAAGIGGDGGLAIPLLAVAFIAVLALALATYRRAH